MRLKALGWITVFGSLLTSGFAVGANAQDDFIHLLVIGAKLPLDATLHPGCDAKRGRNIGDWLSEMVSVLTQTEKSPKSSLVCGPHSASSPFKAPKKGSPTECTWKVSLTMENGGERWLSITARLTPRDRSIERKFLACASNGT